MASQKGDFCAFEAKNDLSHIQRVLGEVSKVLKRKEYNRLSDLSDETVHSATVHQDSVNIVVAVLVYTLYKIFQRKNYRSMEGWDTFHDSLLTNLDVMIASAKAGDCPKFLDAAGLIRESLNEIEGDLAIYIKDVFYKAEINKAFKLYEHGLSSQKIAQLLGVNLWDFASYMGQSSISESKVAITMPEKKRLAAAEAFFS